MSITIPFEDINGHIVIEVEGRRILVDTGSPASIGDEGGFEFLGKTRQLSRDFLGMTVTQLSELVGTPLDVLAGMDVLGVHALTIDGRAKQLTFDAPSNPEAEVLTLGSVMGVPTVPVTVSGGGSTFFLDTGATTTYLAPGMIGGCELVGEKEDFYPGFGKFTVSVHRCPVELAGAKLELECGVLPPPLQLMLGVAGTQGILGTQIYEFFTATIDMKAARLSLADERSTEVER